MAFAKITKLEEIAAVGPLRKTRVVFQGDGAYVAGGSYGFEALFQALMGRPEKVLDVQGVGNNGDFKLEYQSSPPSMVGRSVICDATANTFTTADGLPHGLKVGDAVEVAGAVIPAGLAAATRYYVIAAGLTQTVFELSATVGGGSVDETTAGTAVTFTRKAALFLRVISTAAENGTADLSGSNFEAIVTSY